MITVLPSRAKRSASYRPFLIAVLAGVLLPGAARAQSQPSLAEQAAAARRQPATPVDSQAAGHVVMGEYRNEFFGFTLKPPPGWEALSRGQMNVDEAIGRDAAGLKAGINGDESGRVFGMHDAAGSSVFLAIKAVPAGADTSNLEGKLQQGLRSEMPEIRFGREPILLGDGGHRFAAFRIAYVLKDQPINQTLEYLLFKGHLIAMTVTAPTPEKLTAVLRDLQTRLLWTGAASSP